MHYFGMPRIRTTQLHTPHLKKSSKTVITGIYLDIEAKMVCSHCQNLKKIATIDYCYQHCSSFWYFRLHLRLCLHSQQQSQRGSKLGVHSGLYCTLEHQYFPTSQPRIPFSIENWMSSLRGALLM